MAAKINFYPQNNFILWKLLEYKPHFWILYAHHHKPLLITSCSWIQAIHKDRIFWKNLLRNKEMVFENGVKNVQAAFYNGARTVNEMIIVFLPSETVASKYFSISTSRKWIFENLLEFLIILTFFIGHPMRTLP